MVLVALGLDDLQHLIFRLNYPSSQCYGNELVGSWYLINLGVRTVKDTFM